MACNQQFKPGLSKQVWIHCLVIACLDDDQCIIAQRTNLHQLLRRRQSVTAAIRGIGQQ